MILIVRGVFSHSFILISMYTRSERIIPTSCRSPHLELPMWLFSLVAFIVVTSFLGAYQLGEYSNALTKKMERMRKSKNAVPKRMKKQKLWLDSGKVLLLLVCAGTLLIYASYE
ncbi:hypothetical protein [Shimazuella alba]|uniref:Uncharacterized protein n=1 Tax=Shimazuella alba TaxID=2690964 RepID=A0A6I4VX26_9BACL|nr:hypothetical protein [Shimazuella alba]MXQ54426.1 hypothetical protein [Shimazuella alba]